LSKEKIKNQWLVYIISCSDKTLYTGITTDVEKRFIQHKNKKGAKYFYGRSPEKIVYVEEGYDRSEASKREYEIKQLSREKKLSLINNYNT